MHMTDSPPVNFLAVIADKSRFVDASVDPLSVLLCEPVKTTGADNGFKRNDNADDAKCIVSVPLVIINKSGSTKLNGKIDEKVKMIYSYPSMGGDIIDYYIDKKVHGLVIAATGFGNLPLEDKTILNALKKAENADVPVAITSQTIYGATNRFVYSTLRETSKFGNIIYTGDMTTETAFVKMMFALGNCKKIEDIREMMQKNLAGEKRERSGVSDFLI